MNRFSIGEFSRITRLSIKTLRFYHEQGLIVPAFVAPDTGYRYYDRRNVDQARVVSRLRELEFPISVIREIVGEASDDEDILEQIEQHKLEIAQRVKQYRNVVSSLEKIISIEKEARRAMMNTTFDVEEKTLPDMWVAGIRMKGKYSDCGKGFARIGRKLGRYIRGKPFLLHYDQEWREDDADFEPCMPVREDKDVDGISVRKLPGGRCLSLLHRGPYEEIGLSYGKILGHARARSLEVVVPTREVYLKGPGMIFKGNAKKYLTEIQMLVK